MRTHMRMHAGGRARACAHTMYIYYVTLLLLLLLREKPLKINGFGGNASLLPLRYLVTLSFLWVLLDFGRVRASIHTCACLDPSAMLPRSSALPWHYVSKPWRSQITRASVSADTRSGCLSRPWRTNIHWCPRSDGRPLNSCSVTTEVRRSHSLLARHVRCVVTWRSPEVHAKGSASPSCASVTGCHR